MTSPAAHEARSACFTALGALREGNGAPMAAWLREHLLTQVMPFWESHAVDPRGGLLTCIGDDGRVESTDKWMWSQWRAVWVFSRIHRSVDPDERWLQYAHDVANFAIRHAWDSHTGHWALLVSARGGVLRGYESTHVDAFAVYGLLELYRSCGHDPLLALARATADAALKDITEHPESIPHFPYPIPHGAKPHAIAMMWSLVLAELGEACGDERYIDAARRFANEVFFEFYRPDREMCLEYVRLDGGELPPPEGTIVVPGHVIEDMWFQLHLNKILDGGPERVRLACQLIRHHLEIGWDHDGGGGLVLAIDADGRKPVAWNFAEAKLWWPHTEALYAALLAWSMGGAPELLSWYERLWRFCLTHYVDWEQGEWRQKLDRNLAPITDTIALPVKDPFHLPRSLILQWELLRAGDIRGAARGARAHARGDSVPHAVNGSINPGMSQRTDSAAPRSALNQ